MFGTVGALLLVLLLALASACQSDEEEVSSADATTPSATTLPSPVASPAPSASPYRGGAPPRYETPVLIVPGEYRNHSAVADAEYWQALAADDARPHFSGTVNGFRVYDQRDAFEDPGLYQKECVAVEFEEVKLLDFGDLLPGTYALTPQYAAKCEDGSIAWVLQEFTTLYETFAISYELGEKAMETWVSGAYVRPITLDGHSGVAIGPLTEKGGRSAMAVDFASGFLILETNGLPFHELEKMAEGVTCAGC